MTTVTDSSSRPHSFKRSIVDDLKELLETSIASDITLIVGDKEFKAHKAILMIRSPVFTAMFSHEMKEKKDGKVTISNVNPVIFEKILEFIYTDKVEELEKYAEEMLEFADQYQLQTLKELCQESLCKSITVDDALRIMALADHFNAKQLFDRASGLAVDNIHSLIKSTEYQEIMASNQSTTILSTLVEKLATKIPLPYKEEIIDGPTDDDDDDDDDDEDTLQKTNIEMFYNFY